MATETLSNPTVLAFERKLNPSDALFSAGDWASRDNAMNWQPVRLHETTKRGTQSSRKDGSDILKSGGKVESPNPQKVDEASLPSGNDTLKVQFTLLVLGNIGEPSACNNAKYRETLIAAVNAYIQQHGFKELANRYAANLANGRFLWRNRTLAEQVEVTIAHLKDGKAVTQWKFDALAHSLRDFTAPTAEVRKLAELGALIAEGLSGNGHVLLQITAFVRIGVGQEVFPSQELIMNRERGSKSKTLYDVNDVAAMHSQKIGNAIRTIDSWYPGAAENGPIAVEPYGSVTTQGAAYRSEGKRDFYNLLDNWILKNKPLTVEEQHFVIATLIRGGVFSAEKKDKKKDED